MTFKSAALSRFDLRARDCLDPSAHDLSHVSGEICDQGDQSRTVRVKAYTGKARHEKNEPEYDQQ